MCSKLATNVSLLRQLFRTETSRQKFSKLNISYVRFELCYCYSFLSESEAGWYRTEMSVKFSVCSLGYLKHLAIFQREYIAPKYIVKTCGKKRVSKEQSRLYFDEINFELFFGVSFKPTSLLRSILKLLYI